MTDSLTGAELAHYQEHGYVIAGYRLDDTVVEAIRADHDRLIARQPQFRDYCPNVLAYDLSFLNYARIPEILDMVEQVLGPDFALWNSSFFAKPAHDGRKTPWHQDGEYWPIRPIATCSVWMAIDDSTPENGCLRVIRGSHKARKVLAHETNPAKDLTLNQELLPSVYDENDAVDIVLERGQMSLHDVFLVHGSEANRSPRPRRGMTLRFMPTTSVFDRGLARQQVEEKALQVGHEDRTLYLMRGVDRCERNDFRMRL
ncbi:MAG: phytanoyl-CoA dioxygenase family protein [Gammaproteobacteria bacterium]